MLATKGSLSYPDFQLFFLILFIQVSNFNKQHDPVWASGHRLGKAFLTSGHVTTKSIGKSTLARGPHSNTKSFLLINPRLKNLISESNSSTTIQAISSSYRGCLRKVKREYPLLFNCPWLARVPCTWCHSLLSAEIGREQQIRESMNKGQKRAQLFCS